MTALAPAADVRRPAARTRWDVAEACLAAAAFAVLCVLVLRASPYLPEPDDYAYRASIVAVTHGHFVTLSGLGGWAFHDMYRFPFGSELVVGHGPGGTVELQPGPGVMTGGGRGHAARPSGGPNG